MKDWVMNSSSIPNRNDSQLQLLTFVSLDSNKNWFNGSLHIPLGQLRIAKAGKAIITPQMLPPFLRTLILYLAKDRF